MSVKEAPKISTCKATDNWTCVSFKPDLAKFRMVREGVGEKKGRRRGGRAGGEREWGVASWHSLWRVGGKGEARGLHQSKPESNI
jgi:hypothetical protein